MEYAILYTVSELSNTEDHSTKLREILNQLTCHVQSSRGHTRSLPPRDSHPVGILRVAVGTSSICRTTSDGQGTKREASSLTVTIDPLARDAGSPSPSSQCACPARPIVRRGVLSVILAWWASSTCAIIGRSLSSSQQAVSHYACPERARAASSNPFMWRTPNSPYEAVTGYERRY